MRFLLSRGYEFLTVLLSLAIVFKLFKRVYVSSRRENTPMHLFPVFILAIYITAVFYFTGSGNIFNLLSDDFTINYMKINLIPFSRGIDTTGYLLNVLLFVPFGFLLPFIWVHTNNFIYVLLSGFSFSLIIEISQLFSNRQTDVDDLILNTVGALLGYILFKLFSHITKWSNKRVEYYRFEPLIYIFSMFIGHFILFNEIAFFNMM